MKTKNSKEIFERAKKSIPGGVNSPVRAFQSVEKEYPIFIRSAKGSKLYDEDDNEYIDMIGSWGPMILGHNHPEVLQMVKREIENGTSFGLPTKKEVQLAELIKECYDSIEEVRLTTSGTEATMTAVRLARAYTGKNKIVKFEGCYHGHSDSLMVKAGSGLLTFEHQDSNGITDGVIKDTITLPFGDIEKIKEIVVNEKDIACIIIEPIPANMGIIKTDKNYLEKIMELEIKASDGTFVRVADIATLEQVESPSTISTKNGSKIVTVGTNLDSSKGFNDAAKFIGQAFKKSNPAIGYKLTTSGNAESQREMGGQIMTALMMSIALIYTVLAIQLESFVLPLMIMTTLPLSMIGVIFGLAITRVQMSMFVMIGILMLFGMAVNNAIVLLDFVSGLRTKGVPIREAIIDACGSRLRPILMTTLTTVLGWIPMALALGGGSAGYYQGMAIAVMFGLSFCTFLTLFFIPVTYSLVEERKERKNKEKEEKKKARKLEERAKSI